jgi:DNA-binding transcriptional MerR regulator
MAEPSENPTYNLKAVVRETGIKPDTLRAWERRYGLPKPTRSSGRHRLYSQQDIDTLKWLVARREEGLSISRAVALWENYQNQGLDPFKEMPLTVTIDQTIPVLTGEAIESLRKAWINACLDFDESLAEGILVQAFAQFSPEIVVFDLLAKGLAEMGEGWYRGEVTVQQEHFASAIALRRLETLIAATPAARRPEKILVACATDDQHTFSALLLNFLLRRNGWDVLYLGANVPAQRLNETLQLVKPDLGLFTAQHLPSAAALIPIAEVLYQHEVPFAYGGGVFKRIPNLQSRIPGDYLGDDFTHVVDIVERVLKEKSIDGKVKPLPSEYLSALKQFQDAQAEIGQKVRMEMETTTIPDHLISIATSHLNQNVTATLQLGEMDFLGDDIDWAREMLNLQGFPQEYLDEYLNAYASALGSVLNELSQPILDYFSKNLDRNESLG